MALSRLKIRYIPKEQSFYRDHYHHVLLGLMGVILLLMGVTTGLLYQMSHRPLPTFIAQLPNKQQMSLVPHIEPNLLPDTIIRWTSKAAITAYTFNFADYEKQIQAARPYFTDAGWTDYLSAIQRQGLIENIVQKQLFINSVVSGPPVISNEGDLPGKGYAWRVQIPFLVTYAASGTKSIRNFLVVLTVVRISTAINPQGIGIEQFVMIPR